MEFNQADEWERLWGGLMLQTRFTTRKILRTVFLLALAALWITGFIFVALDFGMSLAAVIFLLFPLPSVFVAFRLRRRWPDVRRREIGYLVVLSFFATAGAIYLVREWYDKGLHLEHAEDLKWSRFEKLMRRDSAFQNVQIRLSRRGHNYYLEGTVVSNADLDRLHSLAHRCGIKKERLDGPFVYSDSLKASRIDGVE